MTTHLTIRSALGIPPKPPRIKGTRTKYTPEQKAHALDLITQGRPQITVARELGIHPNSVSTWVTTARAAAKAEAATSPAGTVRADLLALRTSLGSRLNQLDREREALTKTLASVRDALDI